MQILGNRFRASFQDVDGLEYTGPGNTPAFIEMKCADIFLGDRLVNEDVLYQGLRAQHQAHSAFQLAIGFVTDFLDTLGIGNFAPTAAVFL